MKNIMKKIASRYAVPVALATSLYFFSGNAYTQNLPITEQTKITIKQKQDELESKTNEFVSKASEDAKNKFNQYLADRVLTVQERKDIYNSIKPIVKKYSEKTSQETKNLYNTTKTSLQSKKGAEELEAILKKEGVNVKVLPDSNELFTWGEITFAVFAARMGMILYGAYKRRFHS